MEAKEALPSVTPLLPHFELFFLKRAPKCVSLRAANLEGITDGTCSSSSFLEMAL